MHLHNIRSQEVKSLVKVDGYEVPEGLYYSEEYTWARVENGKVRIGITDYAQKQLREIVFVELPSAGDTVTQNEPFGTVESVKAVSDLVAPVSGKIEEVNGEVGDKPELLNESPYDKGWLIVVSPTNLDADLKALMDFNKAVEWHKSKAKEG
jgi:glycine cleavage system H protein